MSALHKIPYLSEQEYLDFDLAADCRHEYLHGTIYAMSGGTERHSRVTLNIAFQLRIAARGGHCGVFVNDMRLRLDQGRVYYYPDVMLVCDRNDREAIYKEHPCLLAEVLSPSTSSIDRREKCLAYQKIPGLRYYLLVGADRERVEYFQRDSAGEWQMAVLEAGEVLVVECEGYRAELTLAAIYEDVVFD